MTKQWSVVSGQWSVFSGLCALLLAFAPFGLSASHVFQRERVEMTERALQYLAAQVQEYGYVGDSRPRAVTALFILAALSDGVEPGVGVVGAAVDKASDWLLDQGGSGCLGGAEEPHEDHALIALALQQLTGMMSTTTPVIARSVSTTKQPSAGGELSNINRVLFHASLDALQYSLDAQDKGSQPAYSGGWTPDTLNRVGNRTLTAWFLMQVNGAEAWQARIPAGSRGRARAFMLASQKGMDAEKEAERGGFSVDASGLPVRSSTAAGAWTLSHEEPDGIAMRSASDWLRRNPPVWYGPHFFPTHFFATRALWRTRHDDDGAAFAAYFSRVTRLLRERQQSDGAIPFPPGHGEPLLAMGKGYSTAMAILILNADRGLLPLDQ